MGQPSEQCPHPASHCRQRSDRSVMSIEFWLLLQQTSHASNFAPRLPLRYNVSPASHSADFLSPHRPRAGPETGQDRGRGRRLAVAGVAPWARLERGQCQRWDPGGTGGVAVTARRQGQWRFRWRCRGTISYFITKAIDDDLRPPLIDIKAEARGQPFWGVAPAPRRSLSYVAVIGGDKILSRPKFI